CLVGGRAAPGRGPGCVGRHGCRRGCGASGCASLDGASVGGAVSGGGDRWVVGPVASSVVVSWQAAEVVEVAVAEMRRAHPRWGSRRIRLELLRRPAWSDERLAVPSERTIDRILIRRGLLRQRPRKRPRESWNRFERPGPMQLWGIDIVGGIELVDVVTGELRGA